jgi:flagellar basal body-associated protein FliL
MKKGQSSVAIVAILVIFLFAAAVFYIVATGRIPFTGMVIEQRETVIERETVIPQEQPQEPIDINIIQENNQINLTQPGGAGG